MFHQEGQFMRVSRCSKDQNSITFAKKSIDDRIRRRFRHVFFQVPLVACLYKSLTFDLHMISISTNNKVTVTSVDKLRSSQFSQLTIGYTLIDVQGAQGQRKLVKKSTRNVSMTCFRTCKNLLMNPYLNHQHLSQECKFQPDTTHTFTSDMAFVIDQI